MGLEVIGTSPTTGEVLVRDTETRDQYWAPGTPAQISQVTAAIEGAGYFGTISYPEYQSPTPVPVPLPVPIFDSIIMWIQQAIMTIPNTIIEWINKATTALTTTITTWTSWVVNTLSATLEGIKIPLDSIWSWVAVIYNKITDIADTLWATVSSAVSSALGNTWTWIQSSYTWLAGLLSSGLGELRGALQIGISNITGYVSNISSQLSAYFNWLPGFLQSSIVAPLNAWWSQFIGRVLDFPSWVGSLLDAVSTWVTRDIPGHSPWWEGLLDNLWAWFWGQGLKFGQFDFSHFGQQMYIALGKTFRPIEQIFSAVLDGFLGAVIGFIGELGPVAPETSVQNYGSLVRVGSAAVMGLISMMMAGEMLKPLGNLGMGHLAAMIYDMTNFKIITGAFIGVLTAALITTPMRYYYNYVFRPSLPDPRSQDDLFSQGLISFPEYSKLLAYRGIPDQWHDKMADIVYRPLTFLNLNKIATTGVYDEALFTRQLHSASYAPEVIPYMLDMYKKSAVETQKGVMVGASIALYKNGFSTDDMLTFQLKALGFTDTQVPFYVTGAKMAYALDYASDLISAWQTAVRGGNMTIEVYRSKLESLGIVPERIDAYIEREVARMKPMELKAISLGLAVTRYKEGMTDDDQFSSELVMLGCPAADLERTRAAARLDYSYDYTKDLITAYQLAVRNKQISLEMFRDNLLGLGLVPQRVEGYVLQERARLKPSDKLTPLSPALAFYETDQGKVRVDTIRRLRRKDQLTRDQELADLVDTGMTPDYAADIADNDDARGTAKAGSQA